MKDLWVILNYFNYSRDFSNTEGYVSHFNGDVYAFLLLIWETLGIARGAVLGNMSRYTCQGDTDTSRSRCGVLKIDKSHEHEFVGM